MKHLRIIKITVFFIGCIFLFLVACNRNIQGEIKYIKNAPVASEQVLVMIPKEQETTIPTGKAVSTPVTAVRESSATTPVPFRSPIPTPEPEPGFKKTLAQMSTEEKIGQLVMFGFSGTSGVSTEYKSLMRSYKIGNVILYGSNIDKERADGGFSRCRKLTDELRDHSASEIPLLIAIDVEGGSVIRFKWPDKLLSAASLGRGKNIAEAELQFETIGEGLLSAGINTDLAPVMDVAKDPSNTFLDKRIISSSSKVVSEIGTACIRGLHNSGCLSFVKHFPGHGATASDSHETTPIIKKSMEELKAYELIPFASAIDAGVDGVMVGHLSYPNIDKTHIASQSYKLMTSLLREELGFDGIIMSDDFRMNGLRKESPLKEAAVNFLLAGGDMILCGPNHDYQKQILEGLYDAYRSGVLTEKRIDESVIRILTVKQRLG